MRHLHVGPGSLGLGLIAAEMRVAGFEVCLAARNSQKAHLDILESEKSYSLRIAGTRERSVSISSLTRFSHENVDPLIKLIAEPSVRVLTTAVGDGLSELTGVIAEGLLQRRKLGAETLFVLACENTRNSQWLLDQIGRWVRKQGIEPISEEEAVFLPCVVDRICQLRPVTPTRELYVDVEQHSSWKIQANAAFQDLIDKATPKADIMSSMVFVDNAMSHWRRKIWLLNGPHLLMSAQAHSLGIVFLNDFLADRSVHAWARALYEECLSVFLTIEHAFTESELRTEIEHNMSRFVNSRDSVRRILSRLRSSSRIDAFLKDLYIKVGDPVWSYYRETNTIPSQMGAAVFNIVKIISDDRWVEDF